MLYALICNNLWKLLSWIISYWISIQRVSVCLGISFTKAARPRHYVWWRSSKPQALQVVTKSFRSGLMSTTAYVMPRASSVRIEPLLKLFVTTCAVTPCCFFTTRAACLCRAASIRAWPNRETCQYEDVSEYLEWSISRGRIQQTMHWRIRNHLV